MSFAYSPRSRGRHGRAAATRFVEVENSPAVPVVPGAPRLVIETADGLHLLLAERAALVMLTDLFGL
ncbi:MAG: hypothetical protein NTW21_31715 [Verrucomicrobia bacterium]|nr:hypothetical protein [Verrucomicrobiota bacterium]